MNDKQIVQASFTASDLPVNDLTSAAWNNAQPVAIDRYWSGELAPAGRHAEARLLWSAKALHIRFACNQTEPLVVSGTPQFSKKTMNLWDRDVCEVFIAPDAKVVERYLEFEAAPTGEWLDVAIHVTPEKRESDWDFHSGMTAAGLTTITKSSPLEFKMVWIGMRISWNHWIHEPQKGERWRANLFRC